MNDKPNLPRDDNARDQDKPVDVDNAADHRPDDAGAPPRASQPDAPVDVKAPNESILQKRQRSQGMNHSE